VPSQRIKGQEVSILVTTDGDLEAEITDVKNCEITLNFELKDEGYLGEKTNRKDEIFNGVSGTLEIHVHSGDPFDFAGKIKERAQRTTPDRVFNIAGVFSFPSGEIRSITVPDAKFGPVPISTSDRGDYVSMKFEFAAEDYDENEE
jgi:hypothetical protein